MEDEAAALSDLRRNGVKLSRGVRSFVRISSHAPDRPGGSSEEEAPGRGSGDSMRLPGIRTASSKGNVPGGHKSSDTEVHASRPKLLRRKTFDASSIKKGLDNDDTSWTGAKRVGEACPSTMLRDWWCLDDYVLTKKLYEGSSSRVFRATCKKSGMVVALKCYVKSVLHPINHHQVQREITIHSHLVHPNIIDFYGSFEDDRHYYIVQEFAEGGDLFDEMRRRKELMSEEETISLVALPLINALCYLHSEGIIHRDIKPENILFSKNMTLKVADLGLSLNADRERPVTRAGTLEYMAPEVLKNPGKRTVEDNKDKPEFYYDNLVDSWSMGVVIYELLLGFPTFGKKNDEATVSRIFSSKPYFYPEVRRLSPAAQDFMKLALMKTPNQRLDMVALRMHPWITGAPFSPEKRSSESSALLSRRKTIVEFAENAASEGKINVPEVVRRTSRTAGAVSLLERRKTLDSKSFDRVLQRPSLAPLPGSVNRAEDLVAAVAATKISDSFASAPPTSGLSNSLPGSRRSSAQLNRDAVKDMQPSSLRNSLESPKVSDPPTSGLSNSLPGSRRSSAQLNRDAVKDMQPSSIRNSLESPKVLDSFATATATLPKELGSRRSSVQFSRDVVKDIQQMNKPSGIRSSFDSSLASRSNAVAIKSALKK